MLMPARLLSKIFVCGISAKNEYMDDGSHPGFSSAAGDDLVIPSILSVYELIVVFVFSFESILTVTPANRVSSAWSSVVLMSAAACLR